MEKTQREKSIDLHNILLIHTSNCSNSNCPSQNCKKMKDLLYHHSTCIVIEKNNKCSKCRRVNALLQLHAIRCTDPINCNVRNCLKINEMIAANTLINISK